ncbi:hypothetical protein NPIL_588751 [Nephila pilipes]|uniref:Uncharacterized protein n=1 Tax=Nephila pilipes TaxID=299642 RepID=A0A8X6TFT7_NEPPI|nr:hypothetical protein NPIL_588751 [Nephila pilipes]
MDIEPCESNQALTHYVTKYIAKVEPEDLNYGVKQAINRIIQEESEIQRKLFKICMRIFSTCECAYRLFHLPLRYDSRKYILFNARLPDQRYHVVKFKDDYAFGYGANIFER